MTPLHLVSVVALVAGCASTPPPAVQPAADHATHSDGDLVTFGDPPVRALEVLAPGPGEPREVKVVVDEPALKLVMITLRTGTSLPEHHAEVPVTIQALYGAGTMTAGDDQLRLDSAHPVVLAPKVPHAVTPDAGTDLVLLVHHHGRAAHKGH